MLVPATYNIPLTLHQSFAEALERLNQKYGNEFAELNGFAPSQLDYTKFIDAFTADTATNVADVTMDSSANTLSKDICSLEKEMPKPHYKLLAFNKFYYELEKEFGRERADEWLEAEWIGDFYLHDAHSASLVPYCFTGDTKFITDKGIKKLSKMVNKDVRVINKNGAWENATVKHFGESNIMEIVVERYGVEKHIFATPNHHWFICKDKKSELETVETSQLLPNYQIPYNMIKDEGNLQQSEVVENWIVKSVTMTDRYEDVYCVVAPETHSFTLEGNILTSNCYAYDIDKLITKGLFFIPKFNHMPPKHLTTFTDFIGEFVSWTSNRTSGACGLPSFLVYSFYFWKKDVENNYYVRSPEYYRDQEFQRILFKLNQPWLRSDQCSFTNFSIFDRPYFESIFGGKQYPDGTDIIDYEDEFIEYEKAFMKVCSDIRSKNMMTFPVLTYSLLRQDGKFVDEETARWVCKHNMKWGDANFFVSSDVTSLSNCCFDRNQEVMVKINGEVKITTFGELENVGIFKIYHKGSWKDGKLVKIPNTRKMYKVTLMNSAEMILTDNHLNVTRSSNTVKETKDLTTDDYLPVYTNDAVEYVKIKFIDELVDYHDDYVFCFEMEDQSDPYFTLANGIITHNCRLLSDIKDLG